MSSDNNGMLIATDMEEVSFLRALPIFAIETLTWRKIMIKNYGKVTLRNFNRHRGHSVVNLAGLTVGMACFLLIVMWVRDELSYDRWHEHSDQTYWVTFRRPGAR